MLCFAAICPHPPIIVPFIGGRVGIEAQKTIDSMNFLSREMLKEKVDTLIVISPHGTVFMDMMSLNIAEKPEGDFSKLGDSTSFKFKLDMDLSMYIKGLADSNRLPVQTVSEKMDHGTLVPLYFFKKNSPDIRVVPVSFSYLDYGKHFSFGEIIFEAAQDSDKRVGIIASGDLSHRLTKDAPGGFSPHGKIFDDSLIMNLERHDTEAIINTDSELVDNAGECGLRSIIVLLGALSNIDYKFEKYSYEYPFGVGYLVANFTIL